MVCTWVIPMDLAPSVCPRSMERIPPLTVSAIYAPVLMERMKYAAPHMDISMPNSGRSPK